MPETSPQDNHQSPPEPPTSPVEEYESRRRVEIAHVMHHIDTDVVAFGGVHFMTWIITCLGLMIAGEIGPVADEADPEFATLRTTGIALAVVAGLAWLVNFALAIDAAIQGFAHLTVLSWTYRVLAALPWAVLAFEAMVVLLGIAGTW